MYFFSPLSPLIQKYIYIYIYIYIDIAQKSIETSTEGYIEYMCWCNVYCVKSFSVSKLVTFFLLWLYREIIMIIILLSKYVGMVRIEYLNNSSFIMRRCNRFYLELEKKKREKKYWKSIEVYRGIVSFFYQSRKKPSLHAYLYMKIDICCLP